MRMTKYWISIFTILALSMNIPSQVMAQSADKDYTGAIKKYDASFKGIGPEVYFLPPPKTANEILIENYADKKPFSKEIARRLLLQRLLLQLRSTNNLGHFQYLMNPLPSTANSWNDAIEGQKKRKIGLRVMPCRMKRPYFPLKITIAAMHQNFYIRHFPWQIVPTIAMISLP